jgi:phosphopantothenoylcysteine synthetase/decarboxylase
VLNLSCSLSSTSSLLPPFRSITDPLTGQPRELYFFDKMPAAA